VDVSRFEAVFSRGFLQIQTAAYANDTTWNVQIDRNSAQGHLPYHQEAKRKRRLTISQLFLDK